jgi:hypothetical protein
VGRTRQFVTRVVTAVTGLVVPIAAGCGPTAQVPAPTLDPIPDPTAFVGTELTLDLRASGGLGPGRLEFSFAAPELPGLAQRAEIRPYGDGSTARFRWLPLAVDVGAWHVDFTVGQAGGPSSTETIVLTVKPANVSDGTPGFRRPLGAGTTLDLSAEKCVDLDIVVEDSDTAHVDIAQEPVVIPGAVLTRTGDQSARWHWCPTQAQIAAQSRYALILSADDHDHPKSIKDYLILLRKQPPPDCPGAPPGIIHTPRDVSSLAGLTIAADISDDKGLKGAPVVYSSTAPDLSEAEQRTMRLLTGDARSGTWAADVPNPAAALGAGAAVTLYYRFLATDGDDPAGACDHTTVAPATGSYHITVTNPGGAGGQAPCTACSADSQCGGAGDNCVHVGQDSFCGRACAADADCPTGYRCSTGALTSVDGAAARQCVPVSGVCAAPVAVTCVDDGYEPNDTLAAAAARPALAPGTLAGLISCPSIDGTSVDQDWYRIDLAQDADVTVSIAGGDATDLDLLLADAGGAPVAVSQGDTSDERIARCLAAGSYYAAVYSIAAPAANPYSLSLAIAPGTCTPAVCRDDGNEPDDGPASAQVAYVHIEPKFTQRGQICRGNDDWYQLFLGAGETVYAELTFTQTAPDQDLDFHFYDGDVDLTPCDQATPCRDDYGQSADSNEHLVRTVGHDGTYYLVVHGYDGSENAYDLCVSVAPGECPGY